MKQDTPETIRHNPTGIVVEAILILKYDTPRSIFVHPTITTTPELVCPRTTPIFKTQRIPNSSFATMASCRRYSARKYESADVKCLQRTRGSGPGLVGKLPAQQTACDWVLALSNDLFTVIAAH